MAAQYRSAQRLAAELPDAAAVLPTHGFGSLRRDPSETSSRSANALTRDEHRLAAEILAGLDAWPAYYAHMAPATRGRPRPRRGAAPAAADRGRRVGGRLAAAGRGPRRARSSAPTSAGSSRGTAHRARRDARQVAGEAQRELVRIGIDRPAAAATGSPAQWAGGRPLARLQVASLAELRPPATGPGSWRWMCGGIWSGRRPRRRGGAHPAARAARPDRRGAAGQVWVYCQSGYRAALAASLLAAAGREVVAVDDEFGGAGRSGLPLDRHEEAVA